MSAKKSFIIRIRSSQGTWRAEFPSDSATLSDLKGAIFSKYFVPPPEQVLSYDPPTRPRFLEGGDDEPLSGSSLRLSHGQMVYLILGKNHEEEIARRARDAADSSSASSKSAAPSSMSLTSSEFVARVEAEKEAKGKGPKHLPFHEWIADRQKRLAKTPWMIDPPAFDYKPVKRGKSIKFSELPPNAVIKRQQYRHCDVVRVQHMEPFQRFQAEWERDSTIQRGAFLIGKYTEGPSLRKEADDAGKTMIYADVYAMYIPPQRGGPKGVKLLRDPDGELVDAVIAACGFERVGWMITTLPRGGKEYQGDIFMSGREILTAARLQDTYRAGTYSRFATLIVHLAPKLPEAYMISDQGVAMLHGGLVGPSDDPGFMAVKEAPAGTILASVISEMKEIPQGGKFLPDALLVNLLSTVPEKPTTIFKRAEFPPSGSLERLHDYLTAYRETPRHVQLSDFNLLLFLAHVIDIGLVCELAQFVITKTLIPKDLDTRFQAAFTALYT